MTFREIAIKNFKSNIKKYMSYFICCSFSIMIFFMYLTLIFNEKFRKSSIIEKGVMSAFVLPGVALVFFSIVFVSYSHGAFIKYRKKEFGMFMTLGLSIRDIRNIILFENGIIALTSLVVGIISGTIFSPIFFLVIARVINVPGISFSLNYKSFIVTIGLFTLIFILLILVTEIITSDFEIVRLLKEDRTSSKNKVSNKCLAIIGLSILIGSLVSLFILYRMYEYDRGRALLICTISCLIGLYITISQLGSTLIRITKKKKKTYYKNLLLVTNLEYKFKQTKKIMFVVSIMVLVTVFYTSHCLYLFSSAEKTAEDANPYDIAFVQTEDINNISTERINKLIYSKENPVTEHKTIEYVELLPLGKYRQSKFLLSADKLNELTGSKFQVSSGKYIKLVFENFPDDDDKKKFYEPELILNTQDGLRKYYCEKQVYKMFFNGSQSFDYNAIVLNSNDYNKVKNDVKNIKLGKIQLFNFKDWKKTKSIVIRLKEEFIAGNGNEPYVGSVYYSQSYYYNCYSKIELYNYNKQGGGIAFFLSAFIGVFFFIAILIVLFLRLYSEIEDEKRKYIKLFNIGITEQEIKSNIARELRILFFVPPVIGIIIGTVYLCNFASADGYVSSGVFKIELLCDLIMSTAYLAFQGVYYFIAKKRYCDEIIESLEK